MLRLYAKGCKYCDWREAYQEDVHRGMQARDGVWLVPAAAGNDVGNGAAGMYHSKAPAMPKAA